ncbi:MAG: hypothetical protein KME43_13645 [Myxacorys chilensis ATA2-1-KO14]|jgi:hypothetical protein|nr:hypothetical protein [Myxacorys chilensis ATA2-1-KO14]
MQLSKLTMSSALAIAVVGIQSAAWSFTPSNHAISTGDYHLAVQPATSGEAAEQNLDTATKDSSETPPPPVLKQPDVSAESGTKNSNVGELRLTDCQFIPQTAGALVSRQLDALSKCNSGS